MNQLVMFISAIGVLASVAHAKPRIAVETHLALTAEGDYDKVKAKNGGGSIDGDDEDLEKNYGIIGSFDVPMSGKLRLGARVSYSVAEGDDSDLDYSLLTGDVYVRFPFIEGPLSVFAAGGAGVGRVAIDGDVEADGIGLHFVFGGGVEYAVAPGIHLVGGLYYDRVMGNLEGEVNSTDVEVEDAVISRVLLTAGLAF